MPASISTLPVSRGFWFRLLSLFIGSALSIGLIVAMQLPLLHQRASVRIDDSSLTSVTSPGPLAWPSEGSAAVLIPSLGVARSWHDDVVPIASLTKMMTAYVVLRRLPLSMGATGPCITVNADEVAQYDVMKESDQSSVPVVTGEVLCESQLLNGLLVHSASNYAVLLADMVTGSESSFVGMMNATAKSLGLRDSHYADVSGFSDQSVSTAMDQGRLAVLLMKSPLVRAIVDQPSVTLPIAGKVASFTPFVGLDNVIGVKSGRTAQAGGCDVMAMKFRDGTRTETVFAVVLGQQGGNQLGPAGDAALALAQSATLRESITLKKGTVVGRLGWASKRATIRLGATVTFPWWDAKGSPRVIAHVERIDGAVLPGQRVGYVDVGSRPFHRVALLVSAKVTPPTLWQRLR